MGFGYYKRIGGNKGLGLNLSSSGISSSYRTKYGSIGSRGFSIRTGIPGLSFRSGFGSSKNKGTGMLIMLAIIVCGFALYYAGVIIYNFLLFAWWGISELSKLILRGYYKWKERRELKHTAKNVKI